MPTHPSSIPSNSQVIQPTTLSFLSSLAIHNDKSWFDVHRADYDSAKKDYIAFVDGLIDGLSDFDDDITGQSGKSCLFRINRDVRFSHNKAPYKTNLGASIAKGGRKSAFAGYYFHLEPGASFVGGGLWMPMPPALSKVRQEIDYCLDEFRKMVESSVFHTHFGSLAGGPEMRLQRVPKGYTADNPAADYLRFKSFVAMKPISDASLTSTTLLKESINAFKVLSPLLRFLNRALSE